jgi:hypothetical protein
MDILHAEILVCRLRLAIERVRMATQRHQRMSKLGEQGLRIAAKRAYHSDKADEIAARLDAIDKAEPATFAIADAVISERESDLATFEAELRQLSNLPLASSGGAQAPSPAPSASPTVVSVSAQDFQKAVDLQPVMFQGVPVQSTAAAHADAMRQANAHPAETKGPA